MKIFWSWQSDHPGNIGRHLVREALELAAASLNEELAVEEPEREASIDHDRKGVPGSPDLAAIILEKIRNSDVFVADVTPVGTTPNDPPKQLMNPNVAIELGYALHTITDRRMIMVMNTAFGSRADLPFDLQHKAGPIFYELPVDAPKDEIKAVRKTLMADLKIALREIIPLLAPVAATFTEATSRKDDPARYFEAGEVLANRGGRRNGNPNVFTVAGTPILYLRIVPARPTQSLRRAEALHLVRQGPDHLNPFYYHRSGSSFEANAYGAIAFDAVYDKGEIIAAAQLFLNREIWAFNTVTLSPDIATSKHGSLVFYTLSVEQTFALMLREYLKIMNDKLGVPPPYRIEGGGSGLKDYFILMPTNYYDREWGPFHENHVAWSGILPTLDPGAIDHVLLNIFETFFDAAGKTRPKDLHKFPGDQPGTVPR